MKIPSLPYGNGGTSLGKLEEMAQLRILIADDHAGIRRSLRSLVLSHIEWDVCGEAADGVQAVERTKELNPDVVLMDVSMPRMNGIEAASRIHSEFPKTEILIVTQYDTPEMTRLAEKAGAQGYIPKSDIWSSLVPAIESANRKRTNEAQGRQA
jgi:DNA-binding NarL/FixJ family response regulator